MTLRGSATTVVDSELRVGALEETVTVTGEAPTVDVSTAWRHAVRRADVIDALPLASNYVALARLIPLPAVAAPTWADRSRSAPAAA